VDGQHDFCQHGISVSTKSSFRIFFVQEVFNMSLFGKKLEPNSSYGPLPPVPPMSGRPESEPAPAPKAKSRSYGVADLIRLMRTMPVDQNADWVVRVITTTLESVNVHVSEIIEDASKQQSDIEEHILRLETEIDTLTTEIETRRERVLNLQTELSETSQVLDRLRSAERPAEAPSSGSSEASVNAAKGRSLPPPLPPPMRASASGKPPEPTTAS
jgi:hypothetical protein